MTDGRPAVEPEAAGTARAAGAAGAGPTVAILADDLIWATRLVDAVAAAGASPRRIRRIEELDDQLTAGTGFVIVDLTARAYDGIEAIRLAAGTGARIVAVGQHDDVQLRRDALAAGAERMFTYRALFEDGPRALGAWLAR